MAVPNTLTQGGENVRRDNTTFDFGTPYDIMVGLWDGVTMVYTATGLHSHSYTGRVLIYWERPGELLHYLQEDTVDNRQFNLAAGNVRHRELVEPYAGGVFNVTRYNFDLEVKDKSSWSTPETSSVMKVEGTETQPGIYHFMLSLQQENGVYYNNQYFTNPNLRHIIGPYITPPIHSPKLIISQTFTRITYEVNQEMIDDFQGRHSLAA